MVELLEKHPGLAETYQNRLDAKTDALGGRIPATAQPVPQTRQEGNGGNPLKYFMPKIPTGSNF